MNTLDAIKFVRGAVAKNDMSPVLTHFLINEGRIQAFNGSVALGCPIDVDLNCSPKADQFNRAMGSCDETTAIHLANNGKLVIRSGAFKTQVDCVDATTYPAIDPRGGKRIEVTGNLVPALSTLAPFVADDNRNAWACGILFDAQSAFSTNNQVVVQYWLGFTFPARVNIPLAAVREIIRINETPSYIEQHENRLVFFYPGERWLSCQLLTAQWPNIVATIEARFSTADLVGTDVSFFKALKKIAPFCGEQARVYFGPFGMATGLDLENETVVGFPGLSNGIYNINHLQKLEGISDAAAWSQWPQPVSFYNQSCRGIMLGYRE